MSDHAILSPSGSSIWGRCAGSIKAQEGKAGKWYSRTDEGRAAHWVMESVMYGRGRAYDFLGHTSPDGIIVTEEMAEAADMICSDVLDVMSSLGPEARLFCEYRVYAPQVHHEHCWGTLDAAVWSAATRTLFLWDLKFGHSPVRAFENSQMVIYANGLLREIGMDDTRTSVEFRVVQPFCYRSKGPIDKWRVRMSDLRPIWNRLRGKAEEALMDAPTLTPGKHCRNCLARGECSASRQYAYELIDMVNLPYDMDTMGGEALAAERALLQDGADVIKKRLEAIEDQLQHQISSGDSSSGLTLETSYGRLKWTVGAKQAIAFARQFGIDAIKEDVLTPTQAIGKADKVTKKYFEEAIKSVTERPASGFTLAQLEESKAFRAFNKREE
jgi:hypothetical protein